MMKNYTLPIYDKQREWISTARNTMKFSWEKIYYGMGSTDADLESFIAQQRMNFWEITVEDWKELVKMEKAGEERRQKISSAEKSAIIGDGEAVNSIVIPTLKNSCWQKYRRYLLDEQNFLYEDVCAIEDSSFKILKRLNSNTEGNAVKGLVVGNVQSGKTANMAALMSMAADYGWNMFIVLSGTIENLRIQTLNRLLEDLKRPGCNLTWKGIAHPSKNCSVEDKAQSLNFEPRNHNRYLTVCLKNSTRLKNLIQWLHADSKSAGQMKILIIDDESDQAGVNTKSIDADERTKINDLIVNLVANRNESGQTVNNKFAAMNYIGYTATPYANVLNEAGDDSLYPKDFIATLQVSKTYFGPQQIFGDRNTNEYPGLNIIREIPLEEVSIIKQVHNCEEFEFPNEFENAICWFLCSVAAMRSRGYKKPLSMLIHTSQVTKHHDEINKLVRLWFNNHTEYIIEKCEQVWKRETQEFTKDDLLNDYSELAIAEEEIGDYPEFNEIVECLTELINTGVQNIMLGDKGDLSYNKGIHLCIDNCKNSGVKEDGTYVRLAYPQKGVDLDYAPAFIVVGGATLSRGLTIEGLVSTYFLRSTKQGDTLMQMGRWFGYRRGYELLPRIWLTNNALYQFEFLSDMDSELRSYISQMELFDKSPKDYAVVIKQSPSANVLRISAKNKMQGAVLTDMNYSGMHSQTQLFVDDELTLKDNYNNAKIFIESLGQGVKGEGVLGKSSYIWRGIHYSKIFNDLLEKFDFHENLMAFSDLKALRKWIGDVTAEGKLLDWNVVLYGLSEEGKKTAKTITFENCSVKAINRTRKFIREGTINIGVLTDPKEKVADVIYKSLTEAGKEKYDHYKTDNADFIRKEAGLEDTPSIVLYFIDKDSKARSDKRYDLNAPCDVVGLSINIPGDRINEKYAKSIMIDLNKFGLGNDIEGDTDED